jgi:hypothetical protein
VAATAEAEHCVLFPRSDLTWGCHQRTPARHADARQGAVGDDLRSAAAAEDDLDQIIDRVIDHLWGRWVVTGLEGPVDQHASRVLEPVPDEQERSGRSLRGAPDRGRSGDDPAGADGADGALGRNELYTTRELLDVQRRIEWRKNKANPTGRINGWKSILHTLTNYYSDRITAAARRWGSVPPAPVAASRRLHENHNSGNTVGMFVPDRYRGLEPDCTRSTHTWDYSTW